MGHIARRPVVGRIIRMFLAAILVLALIIPGQSSRADDNTGSVRKAVFAGSFYPSDKKTLETAVASCLKRANLKEKIPADIFGLMVPHAGYQYSGPVAAFAYNAIKGKSYKTVILLGSSHRVRFRGVAIDSAASWESPLGRVPVNQEMARTLASRCPAVKVFPAAFAEEHTLEVQLPFLQTSLKDFTIVPLITGSVRQEDFRALSDALASLLRQSPGETLLVVSTDLSHYHPYDIARNMDRRALADIESLDADRLMEDVRTGKSELCGFEAVLAFMRVAQGLNGKAFTLRYANSGDETGDRSRVVGYGSMAFSYPAGSPGLNKKQQALLLGLARKSVEAVVSGKPLPDTDTQDRMLSEKRGVFVTLTKKGDLRGCIGYIKAYQPLDRAISEMAAAAATQDPRFRPVTRAELKDIRIEISVLSPLKLIAGPRDIEVGTHGLYLTKGPYSGLLLPQVAVEHKWNRDEFLGNTCVKAGLPPLSWKDKDTAIYTFTAQIFAE